MDAVRNFHSKRTCLLTQTSPSMKVDCSALRAPTIAASIRNPDYRPPYSYWLARPISMSLRVQARSGSWLLSGTFIVKKGFPDPGKPLPCILVHSNDFFFVVCSASFTYSVRHHKLSTFAALYKVRSGHFPVCSSLVSSCL